MSNVLKYFPEFLLQEAKRLKVLDKEEELLHEGLFEEQMELTFAEDAQAKAKDYGDTKDWAWFNEGIPNHTTKEVVS